MLRTMRSELDSLASIIRLATLAAVAGALYRELRLPPEERTWHGRLLGWIPYDFRLPTPRKLMDAWWNPGSGRVLSDQPFGVGWAVNLPVAWARISPLVAGARTTTRRRRRAAAGSDVR